MHWHDWSPEAFERARERACPLLLYLRASWCPWCRELDRESLADPRVQERLRASFVCMEADKDVHPELDDRYRGGGWPSLVWLDPTGEPLASAGFLEAEPLLARLAAVAEHYDAGGEAVREAFAALEALERAAAAAPPAAARAAARGRRPASLSMELVEEVTRTLIETSDPVYGGWGTNQKFPHPEALHFAIVRWSQTGDPRTLDLVLRTLRNMQRGEIYDRVEGGFYRYATQPDWSVPHHGKMLDSNAHRLMAYVEAYQALGEPSFRETAEGILAWMNATLLDPQTNAFRRSQDADPEYAHLSTLEERRRRGAPECDPTIVTSWNAMAVCALLKSAVVLQDDAWRVQALATLDFLVTSLWHEREGMYHYWDGTYNLPGMLADQAYTLRALVEVAHYAGENRYLGIARQLAERTIERLRAPDGTFHDARFLAASGARSERAILDNAVMAESLLRLSHLLHEPRYARVARETLEAFLPEYRRFGHLIAGYGRAVDLLVHEPIHVAVVGSRGDDRTRALRAAALGPYVASRIVSTLDPAEDAELLARFGLPEPGEEGARAYVFQGRESYAETSRPERLPALMTRTERSN